MKIKRLILVGGLVLATVLCGTSCDNVSLNGDNTFPFNVVNATGGTLASIVIGSTKCTDVAAGETCNAILSTRPVKQDVSYSTVKIATVVTSM